MATSALVALGLTAPVGLTQEQEAPATTEQDEEQEEALVQDTLVITGSRIRRDEFSASAPVQIITTDTSSLQGLVSAAEILQSSSVAAGSGQVNNIFTGFVVDGGPGVDTISLRGLGAQRSLILLNGRRAPPAGVGGTVGPVDLNILPNSIINRFEILKDGASSIYGSDAVAGVVNVITRDNLEGGVVGASVDVSQEGGAEEIVLQGGYGWVFDQGSFNISAEYYEQEALRLGDRENLACPQDFWYNPETGLRSDAIDSRTGEFKCYNSLEGYVQTFYPDNAPFGLGGGFYGSRVLDPGSPGAFEGVPDWRFIPFEERSYDDPRELSTTAISPRERFTIFASGDYRPDFLDGAEVYTEFLYHMRKSEQTNWRQLFPWYHADSPLNPFSGDNPAFDFGPLFGLPPNQFVAPLDGFTVRPIVLVPFDQSQEVDVWRVLGGARGDFDNGWAWDAYVSHSVSDGEYTRDVIPADRVDAGTGTIQDTISLNPDGVCGPSAPAGCVPLDLFAADALFDGALDPAAEEYYLLEETGTTEYTQTIFEAVVTGDLFAAPSGPVAGAFGVHARRDEIDDRPGEFSVDANAWGLLTAGNTKGDDTVLEAFGEIEVPVLRNRPGFEDLTLNASARFSNYDSVGDAFTYKLGLNWQFNSTFRTRATFGTSFRAPALYELFLADQTSFLSQVSVDPCINYGATGEDGGFRVDETVRINCAAEGLAPDYGGGTSSAEVVTGGGFGRLDPEESEAFTVGIVITPPELGLSFAVDYFSIEINDQIGNFAAGVVGACYSDPDFRSEPGFCDLFTRELDPAAPNFGTITEIDASYRNIPTQSTTGFDFTTRFEREFNFGNLVIDSQFTWTLEDEYQLFVGSEVLDQNGLIGEPEVVGNVQTRFTRGDWTGAWTVNYTGRGSNLGFEGEDGRIEGVFYTNGPAESIFSVDPFITHDLSLRREFDTWTLAAGVRNVFDEYAPIISEGDDAGSASRLGNYPLSSQYLDGYIGRSFFLTVNRTF